VRDDVLCADGGEVAAGDGDAEVDLSRLRLHVWSTQAAASSLAAAGTSTASVADAGAVEDQLMYVVLGTVLGAVVLVVVVCTAVCTWRHQQQPRRAVGTSCAPATYLLRFRDVSYAFFDVRKDDLHTGRGRVERGEREGFTSAALQLCNAV